MSSLDDIPFDLGTRESDSQDRVDDIMNALGFADWSDVFIAWEDVEDQYLRGHRYLTAEEGLFDLYDRGLTGFAKLVYFSADNKYSLAVIYP